MVQSVVRCGVVWCIVWCSMVCGDGVICGEEVCGVVYSVVCGVRHGVMYTVVCCNV